MPLEFVNSKLKFELISQTPMIHFQSRQTGATLRAIEVKPKLDKFLRGKMENIPDSFFIPANDGKAPTALQYKMRVFCEEPPRVVHINDSTIHDNRLKYKFYYGDQGNHGELTMGIISNPTVSILCFIPGLQELIVNNIVEFFLAYNFGTMQGKGFGGFLPKDMETEDAVIAAAKALHNRSGSKVYRMRFAQNATPQLMLNAAAHFYKLMKSGYNNSLVHPPEYEKSFIYTYMAEAEHGGFRSEKAYMKQRGISPDYHPNHNRDNVPADGEYRYLRAVLGTTESISYLTGVNSPRKRVTIKPVGNAPSRVPSPILFKVVRNNVLITALPVHEAVFQKTYSFKGYAEGSLQTPTEFDVQDFLASYVVRYNAVLENTNLNREWAANPELPVLLRFLEHAVPVEEVNLNQ